MSRECRACGDDATHEVRPPKRDRDDWIPVCERHKREIQHIAQQVREVDL